VCPSRNRLHDDWLTLLVGQQLRTSLIKDFYYYYISYDDLKDALNTEHETPPTRDNPHPPRYPWGEEDEKKFVTQLEAELDKVARSIPPRQPS
jgi:SPX domain protein involved in polyphosphate accumulation